MGKQGFRGGKSDTVPSRVAQGMTQRLTREEKVQWSTALPGGVLVSDRMLCRLVMSDSVATLWTVARQAPLSMGFPRQEYWSGLSLPSLGDLLDP